ncbi:hypothetical protein JWG45_17160 [Leptospira sp. 201903070]|uniref:Uncharacterized protein n=1 Tax=Leptospira ainlahdjerensis TaxID=2810033 RepID=A0ABS2UER0_9LEPT|nr:hypothetical protein [Leptospira ainlahdjerensis]MBM9578877.1 hypothetical protein [Leptospira ainlahdjerensis]
MILWDRDLNTKKPEQRGFSVKVMNRIFEKLHPFCRNDLIAGLCAGFGRGLNKKLFFVSILFSSALTAQEFKTGVHLINRDKVSHTIVYTESMSPSSQICFVKKSTKAMKNGIVPVSQRENVKGFRILFKENDSKKFQTMTRAVIEPGTTLSCLSMELDSISFGKERWNQKIKDQTLIIENGSLIFRKK